MTIQAPMFATQALPLSSRSPAASTSSSGTSPQQIQNEFLQLLVTQLQNQDPLSPQDPTQFLSQLTEINSVEQLVQANQTLNSIQGALTANTGAKTANP